MNSTDQTSSLWKPITCPRWVIYMLIEPKHWQRQRAVIEVINLLLESKIVPPIPFNTIPIIWLKNTIVSMSSDDARQYGREGKTLFKACVEVELERDPYYNNNDDVRKMTVRCMKNKLVLKTLSSYSYRLSPKKIRKIVAAENFPGQHKHYIYILIGILSKVATVEMADWVYAVSRQVFDRLKSIAPLTVPDIKSLPEAPNTIFSTSSASQRLAAKLMARRRSASTSTARKTSHKVGAGKAAKSALLGSAAGTSASSKSRSSTRG